MEYEKMCVTEGVQKTSIIVFNRILTLQRHQRIPDLTQVDQFREGGNRFFHGRNLFISIIEVSLLCSIKATERKCKSLKAGECSKTHFSIVAEIGCFLYYQGEEK